MNWIVYCAMRAALRYETSLFLQDWKCTTAYIGYNIIHFVDSGNLILASSFYTAFPCTLGFLYFVDARLDVKAGGF